MNIYFAAPLFSEAERDRDVVVEIIFPYIPSPPNKSNSLGRNPNWRFLNGYKSHLHDADMVLALLDGSQFDDGSS